MNFLLKKGYVGSYDSCQQIGPFTHKPSSPLSLMVTNTNTPPTSMTSSTTTTTNSTSLDLGFNNTTNDDDDNDDDDADDDHLNLFNNPNLIDLDLDNYNSLTKFNFNTNNENTIDDNDDNVENDSDENNSQCTGYCALDSECAFCLFVLRSRDDLCNLVSDVWFKREHEARREDEEMTGQNWRVALERQTAAEKRRREFEREDGFDWRAYVNEIEANLEYARCEEDEWDGGGVGGGGCNGGGVKDYETEASVDCLQLPLRFKSSWEACDLRKYHYWVFYQSLLI